MQSISKGRILGAAQAHSPNARWLRSKAELLLAKLSIRHVLFAAFTIIAAAPVLALSIWIERHAVQQEVDAATDKHLLIARNLTAAFSRYVFDVKAGFQLGISTFYSGEQAKGLKDLLTSLEFRHICIVDGVTGEVYRYMPGFAEASKSRIVLKPEMIAEFRSQLKGEDIVITDLRRDTAGKPAFFLLQALPDGRIAYGVVGTNYLVNLQKSIAFGARGHAAVLDQKGAVIAHPFQKWIDSQFDLSKIPPAKAIMSGKTGVMQFYSPAYHANMITAYTSVPETGWGVMVPQPMEELYAQASEVRSAATAISFLALVGAGLLSWWLAKYLARPIQSIGTASEAITQGNFAARAPAFPAYVPHELHKLSGSFNHMVDEISRKNAELVQTAVRAEASNVAKSEFLANMSHELRTPLNAILGFSEIIRDQVMGPVSNPIYPSYAADINNSATHLIKVITDILDLSRVEAGVIPVETGPVYLPEVFERVIRVVEQHARENDVAVTAEINPDLTQRWIATDEAKLVQILLNLLANSVKFTQPGGSILLSATMSPDSIDIVVRDTGIGIAAHDLENVMTPFGQAGNAHHAHEGFGLGLPLSKKLAEALNGNLELDSVLGEGTTVTIRLPLIEVPKPETLRPAA